MGRKPRSLEEIRQQVLKGNSKTFYASSFWIKKRLSILTRDHFKCQRCLNNFVFEKPLDKPRLTDAKYVHHIVPLEQSFDLALRDENLVSLCFFCHEVVEGRAGHWFMPKKKKLTDEQW